MYTGKKVSTFQERFDVLFEESEKTITELAKDLHVSYQTISAWKLGTRSPKLPTIIAIASYFHVTVQWLMGFDVKKEEDESLRRDNREELKQYVGNNQGFVKLVHYMTNKDYALVLDAFRRAEAKMKEAEDGQVHP